MEELVTLSEAARRLNRSEATLRWWRHRGQGPQSFRAGRRVMYRATDLERWIDDQIAADVHRRSL
jgi:predicted DNA-binding transcriptional regulator AlpA